MVALCCASIVIAGCASTNASQGDISDPLEPINRPIYGFNSWLDRWLLRPVTKGYDTVTPRWIKFAVNNFFVHWATPVYAANHLLQGGFAPAARQTGRFVINMTLGIGGIIDAAQDARLPREPTDFGITLGKWGAGDGPYLMLPLFGPSNPREGIGLFVDRAVDPINNMDNSSVRDKLRILRIIDRRRQLLGADKAIDEAADPYIFVREAFLQLRRYRITGEEATEELDDFEAEFEKMLEEEAF